MNRLCRQCPASLQQVGYRHPIEAVAVVFGGVPIEAGSVALIWSAVAFGTVPLKQDIVSCRWQWPSGPGRPEPEQGMATLIRRHFLDVRPPNRLGHCR